MRELLRLTAEEPDRTERYGDHPDQLVDHYGDPGGGPLLVLLHGGFWRDSYDRRHLSPFAASLAGHGMPVALVEYRRGGEGGHADTFDDVREALTRLPGPLVLAGHSAGGHLALWAASRLPDLLRHTVAVSAVTDLADAVERDLGSGAVREFLGEDWHELLPETDPLTMASPSGPVTLVHGTADGQVPMEQSVTYADRHPAQLLRLPGVGHYAPFLPETPAFTTLALALRNLLAEARGPGG
ncbi:alpha/beta hydrolase [Streptomyces sp. ventii]|uniref:Alpha/beta hydrolase n=2 Tax=Streptomyces spiramenti TaxID=2720606 RepID=A0ABX1AQD4_9ACTN|nr:alpha/beta hydrolase [Streptomyces spiramenti]NJP67821.1 alpha/beta hydrolase [Streptomyces spiramenti]